MAVLYVYVCALFSNANCIVQFDAEKLSHVVAMKLVDTLHVLLQDEGTAYKALLKAYEQHGSSLPFSYSHFSTPSFTKGLSDEQCVSVIRNLVQAWKNDNTSCTLGMFMKAENYQHLLFIFFTQHSSKRCLLLACSKINWISVCALHGVLSSRNPDCLKSGTILLLCLQGSTKLFKKACESTTTTCS